MMSFASETTPKIRCQTPALEDAPRIFNLIRESPPLDVNSDYLYMLLCTHFRETCVAAYAGDTLAGAATAYLFPETPDTLFIWQIAVSPKHRKSGLAGTMLNELLARPACRNVRFIEATITPSNRASFRLFEKLAKNLQTAIKQTGLFPKELFHGPGHEEEILIRIGPIQREVSP